MINQILFPRYLSGIVISAFKVGTSGLGGRFVSSGFPGLSGVFLAIFVLYFNDLPSQGLSLISLILSL